MLVCSGSKRGRKLKERLIPSTTRRQFVAATVAATVSALMSEKVRGQDVSRQRSRLAEDPLRPQFHLLPAKNWMNDPNGPIYFNGKYHMFFQYNPKAAVWGNMSWYHSVSRDMIHWRSLPIAMTPTPGSADSFGCFSGSALQVGRRVYQVYTGTQKSSSDKATIRDGHNDVQETQCLAYSDDPSLVRWTKMPEPVIPNPPPEMKITGFRDPSAWKDGDWYYMTVGSGESNVGGCVLLYRSKVSGDLKEWEYLHPLASGAWNGKKTANPCDDGEMWECPDFFALDGGHVLIYSTLGKVFWQSGELDRATMKFAVKKTGELDLGAFYAPKTQLDSKQRRILWGWIPERRSEDAMREAGWSGMMSLPRVLNLEKDGTLRITSLPELTALRMAQLRKSVGQESIMRLRKAKGEVVCSSAVATAAFDMLFRDERANQELLRVSYLPERRAMIVDGKEIRIAQGDLLHLHGYVDGSVIELLVNQRVGYTKRFYYEGESAPDISVKVEQSNATNVMLQRWDIRPISSDRLSSDVSIP